MWNITSESVKIDKIDLKSHIQSQKFTAKLLNVNTDLAKNKTN